MSEEEPMKIEEVLKDGIVVQLSEDELVILNNALNEVCHGIEISEFSTRIGASRQKASALLQQIGKLLTSVERSA